MSQLTKFNVGEKQPDTPWGMSLEKELDRYFTKLNQIINKGLTFADNFDGYIGEITTDATPGNSTAITHGLKRTPTGIIVLEQNKAGSIYKVSKSATQYVIASDVASMTATVLVI